MDEGQSSAPQDFDGIIPSLIESVAKENQTGSLQSERESCHSHKRREGDGGFKHHSSPNYSGPPKRKDFTEFKEFKGKSAGLAPQKAGTYRGSKPPGSGSGSYEWVVKN